MRQIPRIALTVLLAAGMIAVLSSVALANVPPGTYPPASSSFNPANAPGSSHLTSGTPQCVVNTDKSIDCSSYVLGGVGHTNANVNLVASYSATIDCTNNGATWSSPTRRRFRTLARLL